MSISMLALFWFCYFKDVRFEFVYEDSDFNFYFLSERFEDFRF